MRWVYLGKAIETKEEHKELFEKTRNERGDWYKQLFESVDRFIDPDPNDPYAEVRSSIDIDAVIRAEERLRKWIDIHWDTTFQQDLLDRIAERGWDHVTFYKAAMMDRKLFSAIKNNTDYSPKKETAVACCLALKLNEKESGHLLGKAGYSLSRSKKWDMIITYCLRNGISDISVVNDLLYDFGEKTIGV